MCPAPAGLAQARLLLAACGGLRCNRCARAPQRAPAPISRMLHSHVILPKHVSKNAPKGRLLSEQEWRGLGVQQSRGWVHYAIHRCVRLDAHGAGRRSSGRRASPGPSRLGPHARSRPSWRRWCPPRPRGPSGPFELTGVGFIRRALAGQSRTSCCSGGPRARTRPLGSSTASASIPSPARCGSQISSAPAFSGTPSHRYRWACARLPSCLPSGQSGAAPRYIPRCGS